MSFSPNRLPETVSGVLLALLSTALFTLVGVLVRLLSEGIDLFQILLFRQVVFVALLLPAMARSIDLLIKPQRPGLHLLRISGAFCALYLGFVTVSNIPLADATALGFSQVLFVALISGVCLSEPVGRSRWFTLLAGFTGVMLVVQPVFSQTPLLFLLSGLGGALGAAVAVVCVRKIAQSESRVVLLAYQALFVGLLALAPGLISWQWPALHEWGLLLAVGVISSLAQWLGVTAYKQGEANVIANVEYAKMLYAVLFGYWFFSEIPDALALAGMVLIVASAIWPLVIRALHKSPL